MSWLAVLKRILSRHGTQASRKASPRQSRSSPLSIEPLEDRLLLAWMSLGPAPQQDPSLFFSPSDQAYTGRASAVAVTGGNLLLGTAGGGVWWVSLPGPGQAPQWQASDLSKIKPEDVSLRTGFPAGLLDTGALAVDPKDPKIVYAGTGESAGGLDTRSGAGILKSENGGKTWGALVTGTKTSTFAFFRRSVSRIIVDPSDKTSQTLYAAVSNIAGQSVGRGGKFELVDRDSGIYKSPDAGNTWVKITGPVPGFASNNEKIGEGARISDLEYTWDGKQFVLYAGVLSNGSDPAKQMGGIWRSTDGGKSWEHIGYNLNGVSGDPVGRVPFKGTDITRIEFAVGRGADGRDDGVIYAVLASKDKNGNSTLAAVCRTKDGLEWGNIPGPGNFLGKQGDYSMALAVDPKSHHMFVGGADREKDAVKDVEGFIFELDPGKLVPDGDGKGDFKKPAWDRIDTDETKKALPHPDVQAMLVHDGNLYVATDGGLWRRDLAEKKWENLNGTGLSTSQLWSVAQDPKDSDRIIAGLQDNGIAVTEGGKVWNTAYGGDGVKVGFTKSGAVLGGLQRGTLVMGAWEKDALPKMILAFPGGEAHYPFKTVFASNPKGDQILLASRTTVFELLDGQSFKDDLKDISAEKIKDASKDNPITALAFAPAKDGGNPWYKVMFAGLHDGQLYRSANGSEKPAAADWEKLDTPWETGGSGKEISSIAATPDKPGQIWVTLNRFVDGRDQNGSKADGQVYFSTDYGDTWNNYSLNRGGKEGMPNPDALPNLPVHAIAVQPAGQGFLPTVYVATDAGVWKGSRTEKKKWEWKRFDEGLPNVQVMDLSLRTYKNTGKTFLVAGTHGRGVWRIEIGANQGRGAIEGQSLNSVALGTAADTGSGSYTEQVDWGDGSALDTSTPHLDISGNTITFLASHTFPVAGAFFYTATLSRSGSSVVFTGEIDVDDATITTTAQSISATSYTALSNALVATFTDANSNGTADQFTGSIDWGDGSTSVGTITKSGSTFSVRGSHTYRNASPSGTPFAVTVYVESLDGNAATVDSTATVSGPVALQVATVDATEGTSTGTVTVATFTASPGGTFTASIDWGDGHQTTGTVSGSGGNYTVTGSTTPGSVGNFPLAVKIFSSGTEQACATGTFAVDPAALSIVGTSLSPTQGQALDGVVVGRFTDANPKRSTDDYEAWIDWGDGLGEEAATVVAEGGGTFAVVGSYTYARAGSYAVSVAVSNVISSTSVVVPVTVTAAAPVVTGLSVFSGPPQGGVPVTIYGDNLFGATAVAFNSTAATDFVCNDDGSITAIAPALSAGTTYDVTVTTAAGTSSTSTADRYTPTSSAPTVTGLSASSGPTGGNNTVVITGTDVGSAIEVLFGSQPANFHVDSNTQLTAVVPEASAGTVQVTVRTPYGVSATSSSSQYTYQGTAPTVTGLDSVQGPTSGGQFVTVLGENLNTASSISFGGTAAPNFWVQSSTSLVAEVPALSAGTYHIQVTTSYGTSSTSTDDQYTAVSAPTVTSLSSSSGPTGGGGTINLTGTGFTDAYELRFGDVTTTFTLNSSTSITADVPPGVAGAVPVVVSTPGGDSTSGPSYTYNGTAPSVNGISPNRGPLAGGTPVIITGSNLNNTTSVKFDSVDADFVIDSATQLTAYAPASTASTVNVTVTTPYGTSTTSSATQFTYADAAAPEVTGVSVSGATFPSGPMAGGTSVTISGVGFTAATKVMFGDEEAAFTIVSDTQITATAPAHVSGAVDIVVQTPYGSSPLSPFARYSYLAAAPSITSLSASTGSTAGGLDVTITGSNFTTVRRVEFGGVPAPFTIEDDSTIVATTPVNAAGQIDVVLYSPDGVSSTGTQTHFTYSAASGIPTVTSLSTTTGPTGGGTSVTITGTGFVGVNRVAFGSFTATSWVVNSSTSITAIAPAGAAGTIDVRVSTAAGVSAAVSGDHFSYQATAPSITGLSVTSGPAAGGREVTITGANLDGTTSISFGGTAAPSFVVNSPTSVTAVSPAHAAGSVSVTVTSASGTSGGITFQYVNAAPPVISSVTTTFGPTAGGTQVTLVGAGFTGASGVTFDGVAGSSVSVISDRLLTVTSPAHAAGDAPLVVTTAAGSSDVTDAGLFSYVGIGPTITSLGTTSGPTSGGTAVTINGVNLLDVEEVLFGDQPAVYFRAVSDSQIVAISPNAASGAVTVSVVSPFGTSPAGSGTTFTFTTMSSTTPTVTALSTSSGPSSGGTTLTLTGTNLAGTSEVLFNDNPAEFTLLSSTSLSVTAPVGVAGTTVHVTVRTPLGLSSTSSADQFSYQSAAPTVTGVSPSSTTTAGGTLLSISGTNFANASGLTLGGTPIYQYTIRSNTLIEAVVPLMPAGTAHVVVTNPDGSSTTSSASAVTVSSTSSTPTVTGLSVTSGPTGGLTSVTITGSNLGDVFEVRFGDATAEFVVNSSSSITATAPAHASGAVTVSVVSPAGVSSAGSGTTYTYTATAPSITAVSPASGPSAGGSVVTLTGVNFNGASDVKWGSTSSPSFTVVSSTEIIATSPAGSGATNITVTTPYGTSSTGSGNAFSYVAAPTVSSLSASSGSTVGGASLTITGTNFTGLVSVTVGGLPAAAITVNSSTSISITTPAHAPGLADVVVTTAAGSSTVSSASQYTFEEPAPVVSGLSSSGGALAGGGTLTITGSNFTGTSAIWFGDQQAPSFTVVSSTQVTLTIPAATTPGTVDVQVIGQYGTTSDAVTADQYTYYGTPSITSLSPSGDTASGGVPVIITGVNLAGASAVSFSGTSASFSVLSPTSIRAVAPAHATGTVSVTVSSPGGTSSGVNFTYSAATSVTWIGGASGNWSTASGWSSGSLPGSGADVTIPSGCTVTHSTGTDSIHRLTVSGTLIVSGGTLTLGATSTATNLTLSGGTLNGAGDLSVSAFTFSGGTHAGAGTTAIGSGATLTLNASTSALTLSGRTLNNSGTATWTGTNALQLNDGAVWNNLSGGLFNAQNNATISASSGSGSFSNAGTFRKSSSTGTTTIGTGVTFSSTASIDVQSGTLRLGLGSNSGSVSLSSGTTLEFTGGFTLTSGSTITGSGSVVFSGGTTALGGSITASSVTVQSGATVSGAVNITASVTNSGTIHVGGGPGVTGTIAITGSFTQTSTGALNVEIGGLAAGSQFDRLTVSGTATLAGTLNVSLLNGFTPTSGDSFAVITWGSRSGTFTTITGLQQGGTTFTTQYNSGNFTLLALLVEDEPTGDAPAVPEQDGPGEERRVAVFATPAKEPGVDDVWWLLAGADWSVDELPVLSRADGPLLPEGPATTAFDERPVASGVSVAWLLAAALAGAGWNAVPSRKRIGGRAQGRT